MKRGIPVTGLIVLTVAVSVSGTVQDAGSPTSEHRDITGVHAVDLQTSGDLTIRTGETEGLTITAGATCDCPRRRPRARGTRSARPVRRQAVSSRRSAPRPWT